MDWLSEKGSRLLELVVGLVVGTVSTLFGFVLKVNNIGRSVQEQGEDLKRLQEDFDTHVEVADARKVDFVALREKVKNNEDFFRAQLSEHRQELNGRLDRIQGDIKDSRTDIQALTRTILRSLGPLFKDME